MTGTTFPDVLSPAKLGRVLSRIYPSWDEPGYAALLERLGVPPDQKLSEMSKGTRTKLSIVTRFRHGPGCWCWTTEPAGWTRW